MLESDVPEAFELTVTVFEHQSRELGEETHTPDPAIGTIRHRHLVRSDPGGAWVAEQDGRLIACGLALLREGVWGLSLLVVHPEHQSTGVGGAVLRACHAYAEGARGRIILSTTDPRAIRAYARLGLHADPSLTGSGAPRIEAPEGVRQGDASDIPHTEAVDRHVRGAAHGQDIQAMLDTGQTLLVSDRGYTLYGKDGEVRIVAAYDEMAASTLLKAALGRLDHASVMWLTASQQWAIRTCLEARLDLRADQGAVFTGGDVGPFTPYIPNGAYL